jgi:hypothetical protein
MPPDAAVVEVIDVVWQESASRSGHALAETNPVPG